MIYNDGHQEMITESRIFVITIKTNVKLVVCLLMSLCIKGAVTDMRYFARSKFSRSLVHKKNVSLIWHVVFKLGHVFRHERKDTSLEFEWIRRKVVMDNNSR